MRGRKRMGPSGSKRVRSPEAPTNKKPKAVRVWLLGGFRISVGSRTIEGNEWRLRKAAALVKLLALVPGHRMHREQAMELLWPDSGRRAASNSLRSTLHAARKVLDPAKGARYLASEDESLVLCPGGELWVDVDAFEEAAATARRSEDLAAYRAAIDLYGGDLLPEERYQEWTEGRREELRRLHLALLVELAEHYEERHEYESAIEVLYKATAKEPTFEEAHVALMRLHAISGRPERAIAQYERLRGDLSRGLGIEPAASSRRLRDDIAAGNVSVTPSVGPSQEELPSAGEHNLPAQRTSFVGREREMLEVKRTLSATQLLTLTGTGGSGKTRLALEVARDLTASYADGVWLIDLAPLSEPRLVVQEVAGTLEVPEQPGLLLLESLLDALGDKEMLLLLDNCEHLIDAAARLAETLIDSCPRMRVLATSRERLGVIGESTWLVPSLSAPSTQEIPTVEGLEGYESARLFADRASKRHPGFELKPENARAVAQICARLEGIPLAIELAAARVGLLSAEQISDRLGHSPKVLTGGRTTDHRHQTLRAALDWSYELLGEPEQTLFQRLSAFAGGFTLEAAESVGAGGGIEKDDVLELLSQLVDKSLVVAEESWEKGARYRLLEPIRQYAREKLSRSGEGEAVQRRQAEFFLALAEEAESELKGPRQVESLDRLETEHDNLRAALSWSLGRGIDLGPRIACALSLFWYTRGYLSEARTYLEAVAGSDVAPTTVRARALDGLGWIAEPQGDYERARAAYEESLKLYLSSHDKTGIANVLGDLGSLALDRGDYEQATSLLEESLTLHRELGSREDLIGILDGLGVLASARGEREQSISFFSEALALSRGTGNVRRTAVSLGNLGITMLAHGDPGQATALLDESLALFREIGDSSNIAISLMNSALAALTQGDHKRVQVLGEESLELLQKAQDKQHIADCLEIMASAAGARGSAKSAARLWGAAEALREEIGVPLQPEDRRVLEPYLATARSSLGELAWQTTLAEGRAMMPEQAIEYSLGGEKPLLPPPTAHLSGGAPTALTPRGKEIAILVSRGLTNRQIASELSISEHTVATHITKILKRLGLNSRSRLSAWVAERGLPQSFKSS
jgi:predicted ATPase/DNA-binding SARP family transcriptional activator/DNA-binding CsgD family transcriptional regulator/Flp pilus assembly protein TadD